MTIVYGILLVLHLLGWAIVLGGTLVSLKAPRIAPGVLHGILTALVTGIAMVGMHDSVYPNDPKLAMAKFGIKLLIAIVVAALVIVGTREPAKVTTRFLGAIAGLVVVNVALAVLWT
ncbi:hypothetical protein GALL_304320 [mine drainage metagenome]|uniref:Integral membrane protein n=1 Tax=mine drainage metagenome TaxID=410659 RepID=A0A1J5R6L8_9ZZZZ